FDHLMRILQQGNAIARVQAHPNVSAPYALEEVEQLSGPQVLMVLDREPHSCAGNDWLGEAHRLLGTLDELAESGGRVEGFIAAPAGEDGPQYCGAAVTRRAHLGSKSIQIISILRQPDGALHVHIRVFRLGT